MNRELIYDAWAPRDARWSPWVKPVLFACMTTPPATMPAATDVPWDATWAPSPAEGVAIILDLPGVEGVHAALALAARGYRPVPLYNAIPGPQIPSMPMTPSDAFVNLSPIMDALWNGAQTLARLQLASDAPPVFVLDSNRHGPPGKPGEGLFDNRSISFTTDFPSANFLLGHGIRRVILVVPNSMMSPLVIDVKNEKWPPRVPQFDLAHTLRRWQDAGIVIASKLSGSTASASPLHVRKPSWFGWMFHRAAAALGLRRSPFGGFGDWVPEGSAG